MGFMFRKWSFSNMYFKAKTFYSIWAMALFVLALTGCFSGKKSESESMVSPPDMHTSQISLDWIGDYIGVIPCADCQGIYYHLSISEDGLYHIKRMYLGESYKILVDQGQFSWTASGNAIRLDEGQVFIVHENALLYADQDGNRIGGEFANHYRLPKVDVGPLSGDPPRSLTESKWVVEILLKQGEEKWETNLPSLEFESQGKLSGRAQCNSYFSNYSVPATQRIEVGTISSTKMACPKLDDERDYMDALNDMRYFFIWNDKLMLISDEFSPLFLARSILK